MTRWYRVTRDVAADERNNLYGDSVTAGSVFPESAGPLYGCCDLQNGVALVRADGSFFEFPRDAVEPAEASAWDVTAVSGRHELVDVDP